MSHRPVNCVGCGDSITGQCQEIASTHELVLFDITEIGPHCGDCYSMCMDELQDVQKALTTN